MQIYSKSTKNATSPLFTKINAIPQICTSGGDVYYASRNLLIHLLNWKLLPFPQKFIAWLFYMYASG